ncbi:MAG: hypothetical protein J0I41_08495 [Filimonas sp.]|nr:hypothetical protein [Filimonas sp.]
MDEQIIHKNPYRDVAVELSWEIDCIDGQLTILESYTRMLREKVKRIFNNDAISKSLSGDGVDSVLLNPLISHQLLISELAPTHIDNLHSELILGKEKTSNTSGVPFEIFCSNTISHDIKPLFSLGYSASNESDTKETARCKVIAAYEMLQITSCFASGLIDRFLKILILEEDMSDLETPGSYSQSSTIGMSTIINIQCPAATIYFIADALLHETIHCYLFTIERITGDFAIYEEIKKSNRKIRSPWSGRHIEVHFFIHACFVWYGLQSFWRKHNESSNKVNGEPREYFNKAQKGFSGALLTKHLNGLPIPPRILEAIDHMDYNARSLNPTV